MLSNGARESFKALSIRRARPSKSVKAEGVLPSVRR
jgi:hypothetical protein